MDERLMKSDVLIELVAEFFWLNGIKDDCCR